MFLSLALSALLLIFVQNGGVEADAGCKVTCTVELQSWGYEDSQTTGYIKVNDKAYFQSDKSSGGKWPRGISLMTLDPKTCIASGLVTFDTYEKDADKLAAYINKLADYTILLGVTVDEPMHALKVAIPVFVANGIPISDVGDRGKFAFVIQKGIPSMSQFIKGGKGGKPVLLWTQLLTQLASDMDNSGKCKVDLQAWGYEDDVADRRGYIRLNGVPYFQSIMAESDVRFRGINMMTLNSRTCMASGFVHFDTHVGDTDKLIAYLDGLPKGTMVMGITADEPMEQLGPAITTLLANGIKVKNVAVRGKFLFIMTKGYPKSTLVYTQIKGGPALKLHVTITPPKPASVTQFTLVVDDDIDGLYADGVPQTTTVVTRSVNIGQYNISAATKQISIKGKNRPGNCGLIAADASGKFVTDKTWRCSNDFVTNWASPSFDDSAWDLAKATAASGYTWLAETLAGTKLDAKAAMLWTSNCKENQDIYCRSPKY